MEQPNDDASLGRDHEEHGEPDGPLGVVRFQRALHRFGDRRPSISQRPEATVEAAVGGSGAPPDRRHVAPRLMLEVQRRGLSGFWPDGGGPVAVGHAAARDATAAARPATLRRRAEDIGRRASACTRVPHGAVRPSLR